MTRRIPIIELFLSIISLWWAFICFTNNHLFDNLPDLYVIFAEVSQETGWGFVFVTAAAIKIFGILLQKKWMRKLGLTMSAFLYGIISAGFILSGHVLVHSTGTYFALSVLAIWGIREVVERDA
ncbi:hypothetical protein ACWA2C_28295 [Priestia megaterium]